MIKTALSASLIAFAVLAPAASAAPEPKPKPIKEPKAAVLDEKTAKYCAELAAIKPDKTVKEYLALGSDSAKAQMPEWLKQSYRQECSLDQPTKAEPAPDKPFDPSVIGSSYDGGRDRPLHTT